MGVVATRIRPEAVARQCGFCGIELKVNKKAHLTERDKYCAEHRREAARFGWCEGRKPRSKK
ncbi:hypothetical protein [Glutamicibacter sp.]|uniref:hypothetical protein n=1 Tax=Glutamicibacter sp. TaxID=1931995 RepID=UPI003D6BF8AD